MLKALGYRPIARLWFGQALSSIGDEIYRVGLTWMAVQLIGVDAGFLSAAQAAALMLFCFIGGHWADRWESVRTMVCVDLVRAVVVVLPVGYSFFAPVPLVLLVAVALVLSALSAFFDPALQTVLPRFSPDLGTLRAATGLMATTIRMARVVGPSIVGLLAGAIPMIHFFTLDGISFVASALSVRGLESAMQVPSEKPVAPVSMSETLFSGWRAVSSKPGLKFILLSKAVTGSTWTLVFGLGFALMAQELASGDARAFGLMVAAYGFGNFAGALTFGNVHRPRPALMMFVGYLWMGAGFLLIATAPSTKWFMIAAAATGFSGTMNEVTFSHLVQTHFRIVEIPKVFRLRMATETALTLALMLAAPQRFGSCPRGA